MGKSYMTTSDLTGRPIIDDGEVVKIVVLEHPSLTSPVQLDASQTELKEIDGQTDYVLVELVTEFQRQRYVMDPVSFGELFKLDVDEALAGAETYRPSRPSGGAANQGPGINYRELPHAGLPHRGRVTAEEAQVVRDNLDEVNKNRAERGLEPLDPQDPKTAARYGL